MGQHITVSRDISQPISVVWAEISQLSRHTKWMSDAIAITFTTCQTQGIGTTFVCKTKVGPFRTKDHMTVNTWEDLHRIGVSHRGLFRGDGVFDLTSIGPDWTRITWNETLFFPKVFLGRFGAMLAKPILRRIWRQNLTDFEVLIEASKGES